MIHCVIRDPPASFSADFDLISLLPECLSCINLIYSQGIKVILVNMHIGRNLHLEFLFQGKTPTSSNPTGTNVEEQRAAISTDCCGSDLLEFGETCW